MAVGRVTNRMMVQNALDRVQQGQQALNKRRDTLSTGKRIVRVSEDPSGASRVLALRANQRAREQEARNGADAQTLLSLADGQLSSIRRRLQRARDLVVQGASEQGAKDARLAMADEIAEIRAEVVAAANTRHDGRPLFSGFVDGDAVVDNGGVWEYGGDQGQVLRRVGEDDVVRVNVTGDEVFGFAAGADVFSLLDTIETQLRTDDVAGLGQSLDGLDDAMTRLGDAQARIGAATNHVEEAMLRNTDAQLAIRGELSLVEDADMAEAIMELQIQQMSYEATVAALGRTLPPSLVSFLQ